MKISTICVGEIERDVQPPFKFVVTIPLALDGARNAGIAVYVGQSPFTHEHDLSPALVARVAHQVAKALNDQPDTAMTPLRAGQRGRRRQS